VTGPFAHLRAGQPRREIESPLSAPHFRAGRTPVTAIDRVLTVTTTKGFFGRWPRPGSSWHRVIRKVPIGHRLAHRGVQIAGSARPAWTGTRSRSNRAGMLGRSGGTAVTSIVSPTSSPTDVKASTPLGETVGAAPGWRVSVCESRAGGAGGGKRSLPRSQGREGESRRAQHLPYPCR
jgi:hypothetical protein